MSILVDTSVLSQTRKSTFHPETLHWWKQQRPEWLYISSISIHEIRQGIELAPAGSKRDAIEIWLQDFVLPGFAGRVLAVDAAIADMSGRIVASAKTRGHTAELADALIAATAQVNSFRIATHNRKHFRWLGVELVEF